MRGKNLRPCLLYSTNRVCTSVLCSPWSTNLPRGNVRYQLKHNKLVLDNLQQSFIYRQGWLRGFSEGWGWQKVFTAVLQHDSEYHLTVILKEAHSDPDGGPGRRRNPFRLPVNTVSQTCVIMGKSRDDKCWSGHWVKFSRWSPGLSSNASWHGWRHLAQLSVCLRCEPPTFWFYLMSHQPQMVPFWS